MKPVDDIEFAGIMAMLSEVFDDGKQLSSMKMEIYFESLKEFELREIKTAVVDIIKGRVFPSFPKPAEIIREIEGEVSERALMAWVDLKEGIETIGPNVSVKFTDTTIQNVVEFMGGWEEVCLWLKKDLPFKEKEFINLYAMMEGKPAKSEYLLGFIELHNRGRWGDFNPEVKIIGKDKRKSDQRRSLTEGSLPNLLCLEEGKMRSDNEVPQ